MFSSSSAFRNIPCPKGPEQCTFPNCIFSHAPRPSPQSHNNGASGTINTNVGSPEIEDNSGDQKRRKLGDGQQHVSVPSLEAPFLGLQPPKKVAEPVRKLRDGFRNEQSPTEAEIVRRDLVTAMRPISPPSLNSSKKVPPQVKPRVKSATKAAPPKKAETLSPRAVQKDPAPFMTRYALLKKLHEAMVRLNDETSRSYDEIISGLHMSPAELITAANDEEEGMARGKASVYSNIVKMRIASYRKMKVDEWAKTRAEVVRRVEAEEAAASKKFEDTEPWKVLVNQANDVPMSENLATELSIPGQLIMAKRFVLNQPDMRNAGYILTPPSNSAIEEAKAAIMSSLNYEVCDRCKMRFQVFPSGRPEDGALTTQGKCIHHWGKIRKGGLYTCCNEEHGSPGCTTSETHVFKIQSSARLASILQFEGTPENLSAPADKAGYAVAFDCEMAWTTCGLELIRLSATKWPTKEALVDVLVKPYGQILDLNTRFSGITAEQYFAAVPYDPPTDGSCTLPRPPPASLPPGSPSSSMQILPNPAAARLLLYTFISPTTPLIGHSLNSDLDVLRLIHPTCIDTSLLFSHPQGLPYRYGLKTLVKQYLSTDIQTQGASGHDSLEDSRATGDLVLWKVGMEWSYFKSQGWTTKEGKFYGPREVDEGEDESRERGQVGLPPYLKPQGTLAKSGKRKSGAGSGFAVGHV